MRIAGGIISLIAGIFGFLAAIVTISVGGMAGAFETEGADLVVALGYGGVIFSFLVIVFAAIALGMRGRWVGVLLIIFSLLGAVLGGTFVAVTMVLSLIGGVLVVIGGGRESDGRNEKNGSGAIKILLWGGGIVALLLVAIIAIGVTANPEFSSEATRSDSNEISAPIPGPGDTVTLGDKFEFQITNVRTAAKVGAQFFEKEAGEGEVYVIVSYRYKNISDEPISAYDTPDVQLMDSNGVVYNPDLGVSVAVATELDDDRNIVSDINPGISQSDTDGFVVSESRFDLQQWKIQVSDGREKAIFSLLKTKSGTAEAAAGASIFGSQTKDEEIEERTTSTASAQERAETRYSIGEWTQLSDRFEASILSAQARRQIGSEFFEEQADAGELFVAVVYSYRNISDRPISAFSTPTLKLIDPNGIAYSPDLGASAAFATEIDENANAFSDINPGIKKVEGEVFVVSENRFDVRTWRLRLIDGASEIEYRLAGPIENSNDYDVEAQNEVLEEEPSAPEFAPDGGPIVVSMRDQLRDPYVGYPDERGGTPLLFNELLFQRAGIPPDAANAAFHRLAEDPDDYYPSDPYRCCANVASNVAEDDVLNIRVRPQAQAPIIGTLRHNERDVVIHTCFGQVSAQQLFAGAGGQDGIRRTWCLVGENNPVDEQMRLGWVNAAFLDFQRMPLSEVGAISVDAMQPSFDCEKARTAIEKIICSNGEVATTDHWLGIAYKAAGDALSDDQKSDLRNAQRVWLAARNEACGFHANLADQGNGFAAPIAARCLKRSNNRQIIYIDDFVRGQEFASSAGPAYAVRIANFTLERILPGKDVIYLTASPLADRPINARGQCWGIKRGNRQVCNTEPHVCIPAGMLSDPFRFTQHVVAANKTPLASVSGRVCIADFSN